jgi:pyridoxal phosphate enzyme (YggS family)
MLVLENFISIHDYLKQLKQKVTLVAISKTFSLEHIKPLINFGHTDFGENKVQETLNKWKEIISINNNIKLHMVGKLQSNKASEAVNVFSYIHSLDNEKLANKLSAAEKNYAKNLKYFIQVNIGDEIQKSGLLLKETNHFFNYCVNDLHLNVVGLMCLPPVNIDPNKYFEKLKELSLNLNLSDLSMGMSNDYKIAIKNGSTYIRLGSAIFGERVN